MSLFLDMWRTQEVKYIVLTFIEKKNTCNNAWLELFLELNIKFDLSLSKERLKNNTRYIDHYCLIFKSSEFLVKKHFGNFIEF